MSLSATRTVRNKNSKYVRPLTIEQEMADRGIEWRNGALVSVCDRPWEISQEEVSQLQNTEYRSDRETLRESILRGKSHGAEWIANRVTQSRGAWGTPFWTLTEATEQLRSIRRINRAVRNSGIGWSDASATKLVELGIETPIEAICFMNGFHKFSNLSRKWGSCYQIDFRVLNAAMNADVNYKKLPDWVLKILIRIGYKFESDRPGDIWRLIPCAKAWKWCPALPKRIAERVGKMSIKARMLAPIAWAMSGEWASEGSYEVFWLRLQSLLKMDIGEVLTLLFRGSDDEHPRCYPLVHRYRLSWGQKKLTALINEYLGLPQGIINLRRECSLGNCLEEIAAHGDAKTIVNSIFKCNGKATIAAFQNAKQDAWKYAMNLAVGDPDLCQKYFAIQDCIPFYPEAIDFLKSLDSRAALRMVQTLTYKVRGEEKPVEDFLVKDTGMMFEKLKGDRNLGRVRCWLSAHEDVARRFIAEQPNEALPIHKDFHPIDGLSSVDGAWELVMPRSTCDLKLWGNILSHCVGGYGNYVKSGRSVIVGVKVQGVITYTIEMRLHSIGWDCNQFYGVRNSHPNSDLKSLILGEIYKALK
jgi:PcfJ-like protein